MNLLIADDHAGIRSRMIEMIKEAFPDVNLNHACNGSEVLELCSSAGCDALIMDIKMPGHSGIEVLRKLRETTSIPVILISTYPADQYSNAAAKAGANAFISKASLNDDLIPALRAVLCKSMT